MWWSMLERTWLVFGFQIREASLRNMLLSMQSQCNCSFIKVAPSRHESEIAAAQKWDVAKNSCICGRIVMFVTFKSPKQRGFSCSHGWFPRKERRCWAIFPVLTGDIYSYLSKCKTLSLPNVDLNNLHVSVACSVTKDTVDTLRENSMISLSKKV